MVPMICQLPGQRTIVCGQLPNSRHSPCTPCTLCTMFNHAQGAPSFISRANLRAGDANKGHVTQQARKPSWSVVTLAEVNTTNLAALLIFEFSEDGHSGIVRGLSLPRIVTFLSNLWGRSDIHGDGGSGGMSSSDSVSPSPT